MYAVVTTNRLKLVPDRNQKLGLRLAAPDQFTYDVVQTPNYWYAEGMVYDEKGNPVKATINLVNNANGLPLDPKAKPFQLSSGSYSAWTDHSPYEVAVLFAAKGFESQRVQIIKLIDNPDVILKKKSGNEYVAIAVLMLLAAAATKKKKLSGFDTSTVLTLGAAFVLFKGVDLINQIFAALGLGKDKDDKDYEQEASNPNSVLKPAYYLSQTPSKQNAARAAITDSIATKLGEDLINAFGYINDNESEAISVFKRFTTKTQASYFSYIWQNIWDYGDLLTWLKGDSYPNDRLDTGEIREITNYIDNLPS